MKKIAITVEFTAEVPDHVHSDERELITLDLDVSKIRIDGESGPVRGAVVTGYTTQHIEG